MPKVPEISVLVLACWLAVSPPVTAGEFEQNAAQQVIRGQIEAFKSGNNAEAYSYASPTIKNFFPDVSVFMDMVKRGYAPVYAPQDYAFGRVKENPDGSIAQELKVIGPDGRSWTALYSLKRQPDGSWKINAVRLHPGNEQAVVHSAFPEDRSCCRAPRRTGALRSRVFAGARRRIDGQRKSRCTAIVRA